MTRDEIRHLCHHLQEPFVVETAWSNPQRQRWTEQAIEVLPELLLEVEAKEALYQWAFRRMEKAKAVLRVHPAVAAFIRNESQRVGDPTISQGLRDLAAALASEQESSK